MQGGLQIGLPAFLFKRKRSIQNLRSAY